MKTAKEAKEDMEKESAEIEAASSLNPERKRNAWVITSVVLGILVIIMLIIIFKNGGLTGNAVSTETVESNFLSFAKSRGVDAAVVKVDDKGSYYELTYSISGSEGTMGITKDGKYFAQSFLPLTVTTTGTTGAATQEAQEDVPKSDKPVAEAFIFSYCPYGLQFEKGLLPVYDLLKSKADIRIVAIGAMHGDFERVESLRQISIEKLYGTDKLFAYLKEFDNNANIGACSGDASCLNKYLLGIYTKLKIDKSKVENYMKTSAETIYDEQVARASSLGISGSPTFVINGVQVQVSRSPEAIKKAVCSAFNSAPSECSQTLDSTSPSAGFGTSTDSSGSSDTSCNT